MGAADALAKEGVLAEVLDMASLKPLDQELLCASLSKTGRLVTLEDHNIYGGLASAASEVIAQSGIRAAYRPLAIRDVFGLSGTIEELQQALYLTADDVAAAAKALL